MRAWGLTVGGLCLGSLAILATGAAIPSSGANVQSKSTAVAGATRNRTIASLRVQSKVATFGAAAVSTSGQVDRAARRLAAATGLGTLLAAVPSLRSAASPGATDVFVDTTHITATPCPPTPVAPCFTVDSDLQITVQDFPGHVAATVHIAVTTPGGTSGTSSADQYTYAPIPTVSSVAPTSGPLSGGTAVLVTGTDFSGTGFSATQVTVGGQGVTSTCGSAPCFTVNSATSITVDVPAASAGTVDITVTTAGGTSAILSGDKYTYVPVPTVTSVAPTAGPLIGGNTVVLAGTAFTGATDVVVDTTHITATPCPGTPVAPCFSVGSDTQITVEDFPSHAAGTVDITVTTAGGTSATSSADQYTYAPVPTVSSVAPTSGPLSGGTAVTVTGSGFTGAGFSTTQVTVGGGVVTSTCGSSPCFTVTSPTSITVQVPAASAATVDIMVTTPGGTSATSSGDKYTYAAVPSISSVPPAPAPLAAGNTAVLAGTAFTGATDVFVDTTHITATPCPPTPVAPCFTVDSDLQITVQDFPGHVAATVHIAVTTPGGTSGTSSADQYTYAPIPTVSSVAPTSGPLSGGTAVLVTGTDFSGTGFSATQVTVGGQGVTSTCGSAPCFTVNSATSITVDVPAASAGTVDITVTTAGGTSAILSGDKYTYVPVPTVTSVAPTAGPLIAGNALVLAGTAFTGATDVVVDTTHITATPCPGTPVAPCFSVGSDTQITVEDFPSHAAGTVDITVTTAGGTSATSSADQYTYAPVPTVSSVAPTSGPLSGGTAVTVTGSGFTGAGFSTTQVTVGGGVVTST